MMMDETSDTDGLSIDPDMLRLTATKTLRVLELVRCLILSASVSAYLQVTEQCLEF